MRWRQASVLRLPALRGETVRWGGPLGESCWLLTYRPWLRSCTEALVSPKSWSKTLAVRSSCVQPHGTRDHATSGASGVPCCQRYHSIPRDQLRACLRIPSEAPPRHCQLVQRLVEHSPDVSYSAHEYIIHQPL